MTDKPSPADTDRDEDFLARWSRRKAETRHPTASTAEPAADEPSPPGDEDMPPLESLDAESDYTPFLSPRVSEELQRVALRKLFRTPSFNLRDGLDDYDEDFTTFVGLGELVTAEMRRRLRLEAERLAKVTGDESTPQPDQRVETAAALDPEIGPAAASDAEDDVDDADGRAGQT